MSAADRGILRIERIDVREGHAHARVRVLSRIYDRTSIRPGLAGSAVALLPGLAAHTCENGMGAHVVSEIADTQSAHLLEHVAVELMAQAGSPRGLRGETTWDFARDGVGVYHIRLEFDVDLAALAALREAKAICEWLLRPDDEEPPDVQASIERVRAARG